MWISKTTIPARDPPTTTEIRVAVSKEKAVPEPSKLWTGFYPVTSMLLLEVECGAYPILEFAMSWIV